MPDCPELGDFPSQPTGLLYFFYNEAEIMNLRNMGKLFLTVSLLHSCCVQTEINQNFIFPHSKKTTGQSDICILTPEYCLRIFFVVDTAVCREFLKQAFQPLQSRFFFPGVNDKNPTVANC